MSLATMYRPDDLDHFLGNESTVKGLQGLFNRPRNKFPHAILLTGPKGCGKTTLGRIISTMLGAQEADYKEIDSAQMGNKSLIQDIRSQMQLMPQDPKSTCRVWMFDECHMIGVGGASEKNQAQNALLKALEEPPKHVYFILCTTDPQRLLGTLIDRCTAYTVSPLSDSQAGTLLKRVCKAEKIRASKNVREMIVEQSGGHPRNALKLLESIIGLEEEEMEEVIEQEAIKQSAAIELCRALFKREKWGVILGILCGLQGEDPENIRRMMLKYCSSIMLKKNSQENWASAFLILDAFEEPLYNIGWPGVTLACWRIINLA